MEQPNAQDVQAQKDFADLLASLMECVEKYQEGEAGEGNYLVAMNALRDIHKFKDRLKGSIVYHHYEAIARAPAPPPARSTAHRKKLTDEMKREAGYKVCPTCGCLFADNTKLKRHMNTTEKCRHIRIEKEVAINTRNIYRDAIYRPVNQSLGRREEVTPRHSTRHLQPPDNEHILNGHPYRPPFIAEFLLCFAHREEYIKRCCGTENFPMIEDVYLVRPNKMPPQDQEHITPYYYISFKPSPSFLRRDPANACVSLSNFLTPCDVEHYLVVDYGDDQMSWKLSFEAYQYSRTDKKKVRIQNIVRTYDTTEGPVMRKEDTYRLRVCDESHPVTISATQWKNKLRITDETKQDWLEKIGNRYEFPDDLRREPVKDPREGVCDN